MSKVLEILKMGKEILTPEEHWTQGVLARSGNPLNMPSPTSPNATRWCLVGAVQRAWYVVEGESPFEALGSALELLDKLSGVPDTQPGEPRPCAKFNDSHTHGDVLALIDKAIEVQESQPPAPKPSLFDPVPPPPAPKRAPDVTRRRHGGKAASEAANERVAPHKGQQRDLVVRHLAKYPGRGRTSKQIAADTGIGYTSISGRLAECKAVGMVEETGERLDGCGLVRLTARGRVYAEGLGR